MIFEFSPNDFFTNKLVSKSYYKKVEDLSFLGSQSSTIDWKNQKLIPFRVIKNCSQAKKKEFIEIESFFKIFNTILTSIPYSCFDLDKFEKEEKELDFFLNDYFYYCLEYYMELIPSYYIK
jgi:hypothetical protein